MQIPSINNFNFKAGIYWLKPQEAHLDEKTGEMICDSSNNKKREVVHQEQAIESYDEAIKMLGMQARQGLIGTRTTQYCLSELNQNKKLAETLGRFVSYDNKMRIFNKYGEHDAHMYIANDYHLVKSNRGGTVRIHEPHLYYEDGRGVQEVELRNIENRNGSLVVSFNYKGLNNFMDRYASYIDIRPKTKYVRQERPRWQTPQQ